MGYSSGSREEDPMRALAAALVASLALLPAAAGAADKPPRNAIAVRAQVDPPEDVQTTFLAAQLRQGKRGRILRVDFRIHFEDIMQFSVDGSARLVVNGVDVPVVYGRYGSSCDLSLDCLVEGAGWLDLEQAEAEQPGTFIGEPLEIELRGTVSATQNALAEASLFAQLVRR
jgi:hypothetical protein